MRWTHFLLFHLLLQAKENKNVTVVRALAQLMCHCFPDIARFILSFEIVGHAHGALDRGKSRVARHLQLCLCVFLSHVRVYAAVW